MSIPDVRGHAHTLTFVGTATTIVRLGPFTLLTDPNFIPRGKTVPLGYGLRARRLSDPAMAIADLPALDAIVLSHLHGDHFDRVTRRGLDRGLPVLTTPSAAKRLDRWGSAPPRACGAGRRRSSTVTTGHCGSPRFQGSTGPARWPSCFPR